MGWLARSRHLGASLLGDLWDALLPTQCVVCEDVHRRRSPLCERCEEQIVELSRATACPRCGMPLPDPEQPCGWCRGGGLRPFRRVARLATYTEPLRSLIHAMKFHGRWWVADDLASRLGRKPEVSALLARADVVTAVPLHWRRQVQRGFNQSELIARGLGGRKFRRVLARLKPTPPQSLQDSRASRMKNLRDAFALLKPGVVAGRHVLLVDDVMTTGATLRSAARALQAARPASISAVLVAIADPKGRDFRSL